MRNKDFQLRKQEKPGNGIIRIIREQIDLACSICKAYPASAEDSVHEVRKAIKRIRSALRLLRFSLGDERFNEENNKFGNISLLLAELRRSDALQETLFLILGRPDMELPLTVERGLKKFFREKKRSLFHTLSENNNRLTLCLQQLDTAKTQLLNNLPSDIKQKTILAGFVKTYQSGRCRFKKAIKDPSMENNHSLRKAVKNFWYQTQILRMLWPSVLNPFIKSLDRLGSQLGIDHDLAELEAVIKEDAVIRGKHLEKVLTIISMQRKKKQQSAWKLALKIYAEKPSSFSRRMAAYWGVEKERLPKTCLS